METNYCLGYKLGAEVRSNRDIQLPAYPIILWVKLQVKPNYKLNENCDQTMHENIKPALTNGVCSYHFKHSQRDRGMKDRVERVREQTTKYIKSRVAAEAHVIHVAQEVHAATPTAHEETTSVSSSSGDKGKGKLTESSVIGSYSETTEWPSLCYFTARDGPKGTARNTINLG
ncbi:hypothetical protein Scep_003988 [Stephania cephalantha]|uniref:Uncharacterized protein n=1 Tax=Stephania cephalantha TaxID=152367 RepID=A0AAP0KT56_9MAGN